MTTFTRLDELGLEVTGQRLEPDKSLQQQHLDRRQLTLTLA
jgi:hypothetical protein